MRLALVALLVVGCGSAVPSVAPPAVPSMTPAVASANPPSFAPSPRPSVQPPDHDTCQLSIRAVGIFGDELVSFSAQNDDHAAQDKLVREAVGLADSLQPLVAEETAPAFVEWATRLQAVKSASLDYDNGDLVPFINAIGEAGTYGSPLRGACRGS